jgi:hypothetical protein
VTTTPGPRECDLMAKLDPARGIRSFGIRNPPENDDLLSGADRSRIELVEIRIRFVGNITVLVSPCFYDAFFLPTF